MRLLRREIGDCGVLYRKYRYRVQFVSGGWWCPDSWQRYEGVVKIQKGVKCR
jgi:hypothetical protein